MTQLERPDVVTRDVSHDRRVRRVLLIEGIGNVLALSAKTIVGFSTGSFAILADAVHSLTDVANNVVAMFIMRIATEPPDREHPYGHRKYETLAVFGLATLLTVLAFELGLRAIQRDEHVVIQSGWAWWVMVGVFGFNIALASWQALQARRLDSDILRADAQHTFGDIFTTLIGIVGWQFAARGLDWLDTACTIGVAVFVLYLAFGLFKRAVPILVDHIAIDPDELRAAVAVVDGVRKVRSIRSRWIGPDPAVDLVVTVAPDMPTIEAHEIANAVEATLSRQFSVQDVSVHIEPDDSPS